MKAEPSRLIPRKPAVNLELLIIFIGTNVFLKCFAENPDQISKRSLQSFVVYFHCYSLHYVFLCDPVVRQGKGDLTSVQPIKIFKLGRFGIQRHLWPEMGVVARLLGEKVV